MPVSLAHFAESAVRAYKIAMTPPMGPVLLVADSELQERPVAGAPQAAHPKLTLAVAAAGRHGRRRRDRAAAGRGREPVIVADRAARTPAGMAALVELAETLQAAVVDQGGRLNFPSRHPLNQSARARAPIARGRS